MSEIKWTKEQQEVINSRGGNLLVAAAAGSGKTAVLVERIVQMITDQHNPIDIDQLLVVTFTNAAAAEMRERISDAIAKKLDENPDNKHLYRQLTLMHNSSIMTIHSFCLEVIKKNFHLIDLDPAFKIADETEILLLKADVLKELFEDLYSNEDDKFYALVESYGGSKYDYPLEELILRIYNFVQSYPWPEQWLDKMVEDFNITTVEELENTQWIFILKQYTKMMLEGIRTICLEAIKLCNKPMGPIKYEETLKNDLILIDDLIGASKNSFANLAVAFSDISFSRLGRCSKDTDEILKKQVKNLRDNEIKKGLKDIKTKIFYKDINLLVDDLKEVYPILKTLVQVVKEFSVRFKKAKKEKCIIDFNDIEHFALKILLDEKSTEEHVNPSLAAKEFQEKYVEVLIDEYQDSNLVQETILTSISKTYKGVLNMFMVGDVKQSIYRFRLAKPELFMEKYNTYGIGNGDDNKRIDLYKNFRSRKEVIDGVNYIFKRLMNEYVGEMKYDDKAELYLGADYKDYEEGVAGGAVELHLIDREKDEELENMDDDLSELTNIEFEARIIAKRIKELINKNNKVMVYDKKKGNYRLVQYKDIVILLRATSNWSNVFIREFAKQGIPAYADVSKGYFDALEVETMLSLLQIIDNPRQDVPLITVLRSPIVGLSVDELAEIRLCFEEGGFYDALLQYVEGEIISTELRIKLERFLTNLEKWRKEAVYIPLYELIWNLYMETNYYNYVNAMPGGTQRQANLNALIDKAIKYESSSYRGLFNFIRFINKIKASQGDIGAAKVLGENENIVRIMSIHKSKGLEFPVVFVSGLGKQFNELDVRKNILLHQDLGFGPDYIDYEKRVSYRTIAKSALAQKIKLENLSEEMRILYVALTRAREKLILTGSVKKLQNSVINWCNYLNNPYEELPAYALIKAKCYLDWIVPIIAKHKEGEKLRWLAGVMDYEGIEDQSRWEVYCWNFNDIIKDEEEKNKEEYCIEKLINWDVETVYSEYKESIEQKLNWKYKFKDRTLLPIKVSVSEIKRQSQSEDDVYYDFGRQVKENIYKPKFMEGQKQFTATEKGTIFHYVMRQLDFNEINTYNEVKKQLENMVYKGLLTEDKKQTIYIKNIMKFGKSNLFQRMQKAVKVEKEVPFVLGLPLDEIYTEIVNEDNEIVMIQGVIDCYFEEDNEIVLVDYKTDYVSEDTVDIIVNRYKKQMELYAKALEKITEKKVKQKILYLVELGMEYIL